MGEHRDHSPTARSSALAGRLSSKFQHLPQRWPWETQCRAAREPFTKGPPVPPTSPPSRQSAASCRVLSRQLTTPTVGRHRRPQKRADRRQPPIYPEPGPSALLLPLPLPVSSPRPSCPSVDSASQGYVHLSPNPPMDAPWGSAREAAGGCSSESGIMVLEQKPARKEGAPNRCHRTIPTESASPLTIRLVANGPAPAGHPRLAPGLRELVDQHLDLGGAPGRANRGDKMLTLVASALLAATIDDADALRAGGTAGVLGCAKAPSTLPSCAAFAGARRHSTA